MNSFCNNESRNKQYLLTLIQVAMFFLIMNLAFTYISNTLNSEMMNPSKDDDWMDILYKNYFWGSGLFIATGVLYSLFSRMKKSRGNRIKAAFGGWKLLMWILPCAFFVGWHAVSFFQPFLASFAVPYPPQIGSGFNISMPDFQVILLLLLGYTIIARSFQRDVGIGHILRAAIFFTVSLVATIEFHSVCRTAEFAGFLHYGGLNYTQLGYFVTFVVYGGVGTLFGVMYYLSYESKNPGTWRIDWLRLIVWCAVAFYFLWQHDISHLGELGVSIKGYSLILMFIFGNTITTSFFKKTVVQR